MNLKKSIRRILREDSRVYDYDPERNTVPFDERLPFDVDKLLSVGAVFITPAIDGDPKSKTYKEWLNEPYVHLITLKNVFDSNPDSWIHKAITKKGDPELYRKDFVYKFYDGKYNQILWSLEKLGIDPNDMIEDKNNSIQESIKIILREDSNIPRVILRRVTLDELDKIFERSLDDNTEDYENPLSIMYGASYKTFAKFVIDIMISELEGNFDIPIIDDIDLYIEKYREPLFKHYAPIIKDRYMDITSNNVDESVLREELNKKQKVFYGFSGLKNQWVNDNDKTVGDDYFEDKEYQQYYFDNFDDMDMMFGHKYSLFGTRGLEPGDPNRTSKSFDTYNKAFGPMIVRVI